MSSLINMPHYSAEIIKKQEENKRRKTSQAQHIKKCKTLKMKKNKF